MTPQDAAAPKPSRRRGARIALGVVALVVVAIVAVVGFGLSERGLPYIVDRIVARSGGRISVEGPSGSIAGTMRFRRITWRGADATFIADDVVVDWNPGTLLHKHLSIRGLGARHVDLAIKPSPGAAPTSPPTDLALPVRVDVDRLAIGELDWRTGPRSGSIHGLELGYSGDGDGHHVRDLALVSEYGALRGNVDIGAHAPLAVSGHLTLAGDGPLAGANTDVTLEGPLARLDIAARGGYRDATLSLQAIATPFSTTPFASATGELTDVDASTFDASLPHTRARVHLAFGPQGDGIAGTLDLVNDVPGPIDAEALPLARLAAQFTLDGDAFRLAAIDAVLAGGAAKGDGRIALRGERSLHFALTIADLDLARLQSKLTPTRLSGRIVADADAKRQTLEGDVRYRDMTLAFAAAVAERRVDISRFRASAGGGSLAGSAQFALNDANDFSVRATMTNLDPSRFAAVPQATLDGTLAANGVVHPQWRAAVDVALAPSSRLEGLALSGSAKGTVAPRVVSNLAVDVTLGSAHATASGAAGSRGDRLAFTLDAPQLADVAGLLPASLPRPVAGALHADGHLALEGSVAGGDVEWRAQSLRAGNYTAATLAGHASVAPAALSLGTLDTRALVFDAEATSLVVPGRTIETIHASAQGTLARHRATLALRAGDIDATMAVDGSLRNGDRLDDAAWSGTVVSLDNRGAVPLHVDGTAGLALRRHYARIENARIDIADGRVSVGEFIWNQGRVTTHGTFTRIPVASAARLAGRPLPVESTLVLGGEWSIAAAPRLSGSFSVVRENGDVQVDVPSGAATKREGIGITQLQLRGTFHDDALDAQLAFASSRAGSANGTVSIGSVNGATSGKIDRSAPLRVGLRAELSSLAVFQPWFGTVAAVDGRATLDVAATGTVGKPLWTGTLSGNGLAIDAPQYGLHVADGELRAHLADGGVDLDTLRFRGGDGTFEAAGLIALPAAGERAQTHVTWKAERFRITNRPDLRFVVEGNGAVALANRRLALRGNVTVVEGHVEYEPQPTGKLASDIVIEGAPRADREDGAQKTPLALDIEVDLGRDLTFVGEGLDARLAGRVHVTTDANGNVRASGTIRTVNGTYIAFGQRLTIDRGRVIFDGPPDNPALDVVALRKNLPVEAGIEITGTAKVPQVRITSNPPVPENEALAWLVTGQGLNTSGRIDYGALSAASAALLGAHGKPLTAGVAQKLGLDEISLQTSSIGASGAQGTTNQVVVFGKRISDRLSLGYEQGLSLASSAVRLEYALSRQVTLRAEAGTTSGVSIVYRRTFR
jgi:translocation and assembly module TamB